MHIDRKAHPLTSSWMALVTSLWASLMAAGRRGGAEAVPASMSLLIRNDGCTGNDTVHWSVQEKIKLSFHLPPYLSWTFLLTRLHSTSRYWSTCLKPWWFGAQLFWWFLFCALIRVRVYINIYLKKNITSKETVCLLCWLFMSSRGLLLPWARLWWVK